MTTALLVSALACCTTAGVHAQSKEIPGERRTVKATVESVETAARRIVLRTPAGELQTVRVPDQATRLSDIKPGDVVTATYYDNIVLRVKPATEPDVDTRTTGVTRGTGGRPGATTATQQIMTVIIDAIDLDVPSISFRGPRGWNYQTKVQDRDALQRLQVGDRVDIVWTEATLVSLARPAK
jgi:hypothetical protein